MFFSAGERSAGGLKKLMKIAVTYEDGRVFPHFGMAVCVKFYEIEDGQIVSTEMAELKNPGHGFIARVIFGNGADTVITGSIKPSAANALMVSGIMLCAGAQGDADQAVKDYIAGKLVHDPSALTTDEICGHDDDEDPDHTH